MNAKRKWRGQKIMTARIKWTVFLSAGLSGNSQANVDFVRNILLIQSPGRTNSEDSPNQECFLVRLLNPSRAFICDPMWPLFIIWWFPGPCLQWEQWLIFKSVDLFLSDLRCCRDAVAFGCAYCSVVKYPGATHWQLFSWGAPSSSYYKPYDICIMTQRRFTQLST